MLRVAVGVRVAHRHLANQLTNRRSVAQRVSPITTAANMSDKSAASVLRLWFGNGAENRDLLNDGAFIGSLSGFWYNGGAEADAKCAALADLVRACGKEELKGAEWDSPTGLVAQVILCDQISRGAFRGTAEAFAYDPRALALSHRLLAEKAIDDLRYAEAHFALSPLIHSEDLKDQEALLVEMEKLAAKYSGIPMAKFGVSFAKSHLDVVARFGRFPHRNGALGRASTPEEEAWLASGEVPDWAKSQMKK